MADQFLMVAGADLQLKVVDADTFATLATLVDNIAAPILRAIYDATHNRFYAVTSGIIAYWDAATYVPGTVALPAGETPASIAVSNTSKRLYVAGGGGGHIGVQVFNTDTHAAMSDLALVDLAGNADTGRYLYVDQGKNHLWVNGKNLLAAGGERIGGNGVTIYCIDCVTGATLLRVYDFRSDSTLGIAFDPTSSRAYIIGYDDANHAGHGWGFLWTIDTALMTAAILHPIPNNTFDHGFGENHDHNDYTIGPGRWKYVEVDNINMRLLIGGMQFDLLGNLTHDFGLPFGEPPQALAFRNGAITFLDGGVGHIFHWQHANPVTFVVTDSGVPGVGFGELFTPTPPAPQPRLPILSKCNRGAP